METYTTYQEARTALLEKLGITGKARVQSNVIFLNAEINGIMTRITGDQQTAKDRVRAYKKTQTPYNFTINPAVFN